MDLPNIRERVSPVLQVSSMILLQLSYTALLRLHLRLPPLTGAFSATLAGDTRLDRSGLPPVAPILPTLGGRGGAQFDGRRRI